MPLPQEVRNGCLRIFVKNQFPHKIDEYNYIKVYLNLNENIL